MSADELTNALAATAVVFLVLSGLVGFVVADLTHDERYETFAKIAGVVLLGLAVIAGLAAIWTGAATGAFQ